MTLHCEVVERGERLAAAVRQTLTAVTKLKGEVEFVVPGTLPDDGKLIDDSRG
jgi:phenylacetate-CoA ligase